MKNFFACIIALLLCIAPAPAQVGFGGMFPAPGTVHSAGGGGGYTGPGDLQTFSMWWGLRALSAATRGNNAIQACAASDAGGCVNIATDASTGALLTSTNVNGSPCNNTTNVCTVKILYDQTGNGFNITQNTESNRLILRASCIGSLPCLRSTVPNISVTSSSYTRAQPVSVYAVGNRTANFTTDQIIIQDFTNNAVKLTWGGFGAANQIEANAGNSATQSASDSAFHGIGATYNGTSGITVVDTTATTSQDTGTSGFSSAQIALMCGGCGGGSGATADLTEAGYVASGLTSGNLTALTGNAKTYWGY